MSEDSVSERTFEQQRRDAAARASKEQSNEAMREAVKGLFVMNGGGSVAVLAFLQAISKEHEALGRHLVFGITPMVLGVVLAGFVHFLRYHTFSVMQTARIDATVLKSNRKFRALYVSFAYASLILFIIGMVIILFGVWKEYVLK